MYCDNFFDILNIFEVEFDCRFMEYQIFVPKLLKNNSENFYFQIICRANVKIQIHSVQVEAMTSGQNSGTHIVGCVTDI